MIDDIECYQKFYGNYNIMDFLILHFKFKIYLTQTVYFKK